MHRPHSKVLLKGEKLFNDCDMVGRCKTWPVSAVGACEPVLEAKAEMMETSFVLGVYSECRLAVGHVALGVISVWAHLDGGIDEGIRCIMTGVVRLRSVAHGVFESDAH